MVVMLTLMLWDSEVILILMWILELDCHGLACLGSESVTLSEANTFGQESSIPQFINLPLLEL